MSIARKKYRYPGINSFEEAQRDRFHGRTEETERLCAMLMQEKLTVLFGKSGYGKTSLINAGVRPALAEKSHRGKRQYLSIYFRFNAWNGEETLLEKFTRKLNLAAQEAGLTAAVHGVALPETLWGAFRALQLAQEAVFVLLFDQFEEFFTYPPDQQLSFKNQLAELLYADYPHFLEQNEAHLSPKQIEALSGRLEVRTLFAIRADRLHELDRLSDRLFAILSNRIELRALPRAEAEKAIVLPASLPQSEGYEGAPFRFDRAALDQVLNFLSDDQQLVETNQLQILCDSFEQRTITDGITEFSPENLGDLKQVIARYYHDKIADIADASTKLAVQRLCEEGLTQEGEPPIRLSMHEAQIVGIYKIPLPLLSYLVDQRLLRADLGAGGGYVYELPHDTLLLPVLEAKRVRHEAEAATAERLAAEDALRRAQEAEAKAAEERQLKNEAILGRKRARAFAFLSGIVAAAAIALGIVAFKLFHVAEQSRIEAQENLKNAYLSDIARYKREIELAERNRKSFEQYKADKDLMLLESHKIDSLRHQIMELETLIKIIE